jgi:hypothetical protein
MSGITYDATITNIASATEDTTNCTSVWKLQLNDIDQYGNVWVNPTKLPCWKPGKCLLIQFYNTATSTCPTFPTYPFIGIVMLQDLPDPYSAPSFRFSFDFSKNVIEYYTGNQGLPLVFQYAIPNLSSMWKSGTTNLVKICYISETTASLSLNSKLLGTFTHSTIPTGSIGIYAPCLKQAPLAELR